MKKNLRTIQGDEIDLVDLIRQLFKEKVLILFISIIFGLLAFLHAYSKNKNAEFKIEGTFKTEILDSNNELIKLDFGDHFFDLENFSLFLEKKKNEHFKQVSKLNNSSLIDYFSTKNLKILPNTNNQTNKHNQTNLDWQNYNFSFIFPKKLDFDGVYFVINYLEFTKESKNFRDKSFQKKFYQKKIDEKLRALNVSKKIETDADMSRAQASVAKDFTLINSILLSEEINNLRKIYSEIDDKEFFRLYYLIQKPVPIENKSLSLYFIIGLMIGLLLSFLIIFCKNIYNK